ncbi:uncharacterized protein LOC141934935 isoform X1 [Strix aluco]|uniref:uncharacterized protein LOC141934935 isoform X1 n=1 Tax=Strix aluco TaxID=111821 RepID=UPI003DA3DCA3
MGISAWTWSSSILPAQRGPAPDHHDPAWPRPLLSRQAVANTRSVRIPNTRMARDKGTRASRNFKAASATSAPSPRRSAPVLLAQGTPSTNPLPLAAPAQPPHRLINAVSITRLKELHGDHSLQPSTLPKNPTASREAQARTRCAHAWALGGERGIRAASTRRGTIPPSQCSGPRFPPFGTPTAPPSPHSPSPSGFPGALPPPFLKQAGWQPRRAVINGAALPITGSASRALASTGLFIYFT